METPTTEEVVAAFVARQSGRGWDVLTDGDTLRETRAGPDGYLRLLASWNTKEHRGWVTVRRQPARGGTIAQVALEWELLQVGYLPVPPEDGGRDRTDEWQDWRRPE